MPFFHGNDPLRALAAIRFRSRHFGPSFEPWRSRSAKQHGHSPRAIAAICVRRWCDSGLSEGIARRNNGAFSARMKDFSRII